MPLVVTHAQNKIVGGNARIVYQNIKPTVSLFDIGYNAGTILRA